MRGILVLSMVGWTVSAHAELVPGLPVYSMDGSVDTSRTVAGFQAQVWQISTPLPARLTGMTVDDQGRVWIAWQSDVLRQDGFSLSGWVRKDVFLGKLEEGGVEIVVPVASRAAQPWWTYAITAGPGGPWCAISMGEDRGAHREATIHVFPCDDTEAGSIQAHTIHSTWGLVFIGGEPVILEDSFFGLQAYWVRSDFAEKVHTQSHLGSGLSCCGWPQAAQVGPALAVLWGGSISFPHSGNFSASYDFLSIHRDGRWETERVVESSMRDVGDQRNLVSFATAMDIGSDGASGLYVPFIQDEAPQAEPDRADDRSWVPFSINARMQVRAYEAATLDTVEEWTLGYSERREVASALTTHAAVTVGHEHVGFAVTRAGNLDLWVLTGLTWYGPYRIASGISVPSSLEYQSEYHFTRTASPISTPDIAVDAEGRYWLAWDRDGTVHVARVSPEDLGLAVPTGITRTERPRPPVLAQNAPNPFNAQTVIEVHVPSGEGRADTRIDIFNLRAQRVRSLALPPGSNRVVWDGTDDSGRSVASGVYLYRLQDGNHTWAFRRMALIR